MEICGRVLYSLHDNYSALSMKRIHFEWFTEKHSLEFSLISSYYEVMMRVQPSIGHPWLVVSGEALGGAIWPWSLARSHHRQCRQSSSGFHPAQSWPGALPWPATSWLPTCIITVTRSISVTAHMWVMLDDVHKGERNTEEAETMFFTTTRWFC